MKIAAHQSLEAHAAASRMLGMIAARAQSGL
jgi:hypothetical protein